MTVFGDLEELTRDRELLTQEIFVPNEWYGHACAIRRHAGFPEDYQIKAAVEHFPNLRHAHWDVDLNAEVPSVLISSSFRSEYLRTHTHKPIFCIGSLLTYAEDLLDDVTLIRERRRLGKNVTVFPEHSTHFINVDYDIEDYCNGLEELRKDFDTIRICIYWKDFLRGGAKPYQDRGYEIVTAGHMYDTSFLSRLKSILKTSDAVVVNQISTVVGYAISLGIPVSMLDSKSLSRSMDASATDDVKVPDSMDEYNKDSNLISLRESFSNSGFEISDAQVELVNKYWGFSELRTPEELRLILDISEDMFSKGAEFFIANTNSVGEQSSEYLTDDLNQKAARLLEHEVLSSPNNAGILYGYALSLGRLGRYQEALVYLDSDIFKSDYVEEAQKLKKELSDLISSAGKGGEVSSDTNTTGQAGSDAEVNHLMDQTLSELKAGNIAKAVEIVDQAIAYNHPVRDLYHIHGLCFIQAGDLNAAKSAFEKELSYFPDNVPVREYLLEVKKELGLSS